MAQRNLSATDSNEEVLVRANLPLVHYAVAEIAGRIPRHVSREDLASAAMFGLAQAARSYDDARGIAFEKYAMIRIRGSLLDELRGRDWASRSVRTMARKMDDASDRLTNQMSRTPSREEIAKEMGIAVEEVERIVGDVHRGTVLNYEALLTDGEASDVLPAEEPTPADALLSRERRAFLMDAIVALPERLRHVVVGYFFEERPMQELADELGVSESRVSQMRAEALELMRAGMNASLDPDLVPAEPRPGGRLARKRAAYYAAVAAGSTARARIDAGADDVAARLKASYARTA